MLVYNNTDIYYCIWRNIIMKLNATKFTELNEKEMQMNGGGIWQIPTTLGGWAGVVVAGGKIVKAGYDAGKWIGEQAYKK